MGIVDKQFVNNNLSHELPISTSKFYRNGHSRFRFLKYQSIVVADLPDDESLVSRISFRSSKENSHRVCRYRSALATGPFELFAGDLCTDIRRAGKVRRNEQPMKEIRPVNSCRYVPALHKMIIDCCARSLFQSAIYFSGLF